MFQPDLVVRSRRVVANDGVRPAAVHVRQGKIVGVLDFEEVPAGCPLDEAADSIVLPGLFDTFVHVNEGEHPEPADFQAVTRAAAAGGVTTILDAGDYAVTTVGALERKRHAAEGSSFVDVGFWGACVPGNSRELPALAAEGAFGFACSLARSAGKVSSLSEADLRVAMPTIARLSLPFLAHPELPDPSSPSASRLEPPRGLRRTLSRLGLSRANHRYADFLASQPKDIENRAIALLIRLCREYRTRTHIAHLSSSDTLAPIFHARAERLPITVDTCPHYLTFVAEEIADGATEFKCAPPIRGRENREFLWAALKGGLIQMVVSDHAAPCSAVRPCRSGDFFLAPAGISSLELSLAATWTAASSRECSVSQLAHWMCRAPAQLAGLDRKGAVEVGYDADLVIWDPDRELTAGAAAEHGPKTPYAGCRLRGVVERTYLAGVRVYERGATMAAPRGRLLARGSTSTTIVPVVSWPSAV